MPNRLNQRQTNGLANLCFDLAKASLIGTVALSTTQSDTLKSLLILLLSGIAGAFFILLALEFLQEET